MANDCGFSIRAVSDNKDALDRLFKIMNYEDPEFFIYRVRDVYKDNDLLEEDGLFVMSLYGDVAWSCGPWVLDEEDKQCLMTVGYEKKEDGTEDYNKPIKGTAHFNNLPNICKELGIAMEIWAEEYAMCFQEHILISKDGTFDDDAKDAEYIWEDDEDYSEDSDRYWRKGYDDFGEFETPLTIWEWTD